MNKARLEREGSLPAQIHCDPELVKEVLNFLNEHVRPFFSP